VQLLAVTRNNLFDPVQLHAHNSTGSCFSGWYALVFKKLFVTWQLTLRSDSRSSVGSDSKTLNFVIDRYRAQTGGAWLHRATRSFNSIGRSLLREIAGFLDMRRRLGWFSRR
jgi:hypothetical protein